MACFCRICGRPCDCGEDICASCELGMESVTQGGSSISWGAEHCRGGRLISRQVNVIAPKPLSCISLSCFYKFFKESIFYSLLLEYHKKRIDYAEKNPNKLILKKYRTGEQSPKSIKSALFSLFILSIPFIRDRGKEKI